MLLDDVFVDYKILKKWQIYLNLFSTGPSTRQTHEHPTHIYTPTHTNAHTPMIAISENATRCISPKNSAFFALIIGIYNFDKN